MREVKIHGKKGHDFRNHAKKRMALLSVIVPCYNEEENVKYFYDELMKNQPFFEEISVLPGFPPYFSEALANTAQKAELKLRFRLSKKPRRVFCESRKYFSGCQCGI